jgi:hypothetical protein
LKLTAKELQKLDLIDAVIPEPLGGAHRAPEEAAANLERYLGEALRDLKRLKMATVLKRRYERLRSLGSFFESPQPKKRATRTTRSKTASPRVSPSVPADRVATAKSPRTSVAR